MGSYFLDLLFSDSDSLQLYAGIHPIHFEHFFRLLANRFPYAVHDEVKEQAVFVRAVLDLRRAPGWIAGQLPKLI